MIIVYRVYMFRSIIAHKESCTIREFPHILISAKSLPPTFITCKKIIQGAVCNSFVASLGINADKHYVDPVSDQVQWRLGVIWDFIFCRKFVETFNPFLPPFFDSDICHTCPICNTAVSLHLWQCLDCRLKQVLFTAVLLKKSVACPMYINKNQRNLLFYNSLR